MIDHNQYVKDQIEEAINEVTQVIDGCLDASPKSIVYVYEHLLKILVKRSKHSKQCFKSTKSPVISIKEPIGFLHTLTSYENRKLLTFLLKSMKFEGYRYESHCYDKFLPSANAFGSIGLFNWGIGSLATPRMMVKGIISLNSVFKVLIDNTPSAHCKHITTFGKNDSQDKAENYYNNVVNETVRFRYNGCIYAIAFSNDHYVYIKENVVWGNKREFATGLIADNETLLADDLEIFATPDGVTVFEMDVYDEIKVHRENIVQLIEARESKQKPKKK